ncbi:energy-coupling factor transporter ATP-binding protein EcfA2 [Lipingzhangella halophila]|uniref:Nuclease SbcCD subunit C n=1 Tax=Lipingzhangella halophila TaxID=1783352 RepID=A0A7W7RC75_9ACTN|nr:AAA family ATPase [Lipingzhangella halophila]MBB4929335.1 energy-coupling factor transporter ATP-binding protein EcfA2 [Lipingzhangella halophila]
MELGVVTTVTTSHQAFTGEPRPPDDGGGGASEAVLARLASSPIDPLARQWVAAALHEDGDNALAACAQGEPPPVPEPVRAQEAPQGQVRYSYLSRIEVQGFRGIGRPTALEFPPAPGLTVIVGRNGSGKSSFAEAAEAALTGRNLRWDAMPTAWRDGWRNLHYDERTEVTLDLMLSGDAVPTRVTRTWAGDSVRSARGSVEWPGGGTTTLRGLGWDDELVRYRPFLSYDELGRTITGRAAELYDTITTILGLTDLADAERRLARTCDKLAKQRDRPNRILGQLVDRLRESGDPRATRAVELLTATSIDLEQLASIASDTGPADPERQVVLRRLRRLAVPERSVLTDVVNELRGAAMELAMTAGTKGDRARGIVDLLRQATEHQQRHPTETDCPTCGANQAFGPGWAAKAKAQIAALEPVAATASAAYERAEAARDQARFLMAPMPSWLPPDSELGQVWAQWEAGTHLTDLGELADHIENVGRRLRSTAVAARKEAGARLEDPTDGWGDLAEQLSEWVDDARASMRAAEALRPAEQALWWLTEQAREIRASRLSPLAAYAEQVWHLLRQERRIDLEALRLVGRGTQRRVAVDVTVDGAEGDANSPGLLSQGEFQALALSICLPRTMVSGNPFGFLVIDDPVQAMDTETVEGLASVLAEVGRHRQIIVFTHDTRLPDALRRLGLPATIRAIQRDAMSNVQVADYGY